MLVAILHRKFKPDDERKEDLLTANVLGAARYLPAAACWTPLLQAAQTLDGAPLDVPPSVEPVEAQFWPRWHHDDGRITEPDLVLRWPGALVAVEVKYLSGKSSEAEEDTAAVTDQLARQMVLARRIAESEGRRWGMLYLTAAPVLPRGALAKSLAEVEDKLGADLRAHLAWASWTDVRAGFEAWEPERHGDRLLRDDLVAYLTSLGFGGFDGIRTAPVVPGVWRFSSAPAGGFEWPSITAPASWRFTPPPSENR